MTPHMACAMHESSQIGDARRRAARLAEELDFDEVAAGRLALVVTELATNLVRHARGGSLLIGRFQSTLGMSIELVSLDQGPGMRDVTASIRDGVSTGGTSGTGLGAVRRLSNQFHVFSQAPSGTIIVARICRDSRVGAIAEAPGREISHAGISVAAPGETVSGDAWSYRPTDRGAALMLADGLGHGPDAAAAADAAAAVFDGRASDDIKGILESSHLALRSTRGAAMAVAHVDVADRQVSFCGAGNISGRLISGVHDRSLMSQHGTVGLQVRRVDEIRYELPVHAMLVMHSDGIESRWHLKELPELLACEPIVIAAHLIRAHLRGRDDATVAVVKVH